MRKLVVVMMMLAGMAALYGQSPAYITDLRGTVELKAPGASWRAAVEGEALAGQTLVSTGFRSTAQIRIGNTTIQVKPLTRLSLEELSAEAETDQVAIQLRAGRVRADVNAASDRRHISFTVRSPIATASVRGTVFEFDTVNLRVTEGVVEFSGTDRSVVYVIDGQSSALDPVSGRTEPPVESGAAQAAPAPFGVEVISAPPQPMPGPVLEAPVDMDLRWE
jgi:hypothetical protein